MNFTPGRPINRGYDIVKTLWPDVTRVDWGDWRWQFANRIRGIEALEMLLCLPDGGLPAYEGLVSTYRYAVTPYYLSLIDWSDPCDPIRKQCLPDLKEITFKLPGSNEDPLAEERYSPVPGLIHRYPDRVLVVLTDMCAMYCRHCNRKRNWKGETERTLGKAALDCILAYIKNTPVIREVIISGGDPLLVSLGFLEKFLWGIRAVSHVEIIRVGTRVPVVLPMRITDALCEVLSRHRPLWVNTHFNHPNELTDSAISACDKILRAGIPVSNQTVLLKGVNDSTQVILELCKALQKYMIRPYYLFHCDAVLGTDHFRTGIRKGIEIMNALEGSLGGLAVPKYVVDLPNGGGKAGVMPSRLLSIDDNIAAFKTAEGRFIRYPAPNGADITII